MAKSTRKVWNKDVYDPNFQSKCPYCGTVNERGVQFCVRCGAKIR